MAWQESEHPRDAEGQFRDKTGGWADRVSFEAGLAGALRSIWAYDSVPRRIEWDDLLHGEGADQAMRDALEDYGWHHDETTNAYLRGLTAREKERVAPRVESIQERVEQIDRAMAPLPRSIVAYRGVSDPDAWLVRGMEPGYTSTSTDPGVAARFVEAYGGATIRLLVPAGIGAVGLGPDEMEILLQRGLRYRGVRRSDSEIDAEVLL